MFFQGLGRFRHVFRVGEGLGIPGVQLKLDFVPYKLVSWRFYFLGGPCALAQHIMCAGATHTLCVDTTHIVC